MFNRYTIPYLISCFLLVFLSGCATSPLSDVEMPPKAHPERIQSTIFQQEEDLEAGVEVVNEEDGEEDGKEAGEEAAVAEPVMEPKSLIPAGITLKLKGREVDYEVLETVPDPGNRTVTVWAEPTTPYAEIVQVLDKLHDMGFFVSLSAKK